MLISPKTRTLEIKGTILLDKTLASTKRIVIHQGGARSSKTYSIAQFFIIEALRNKNKRFSIVRKTMPSLRASAMRDFFDILGSLNLYDPNNHNKSENTYVLNGNEFEFFSVDQPQKVRGRKRDYLWINEANEIELEDWIQLMLRTTGRAFIDFNPSITEEHWIYSELINKEEGNYDLTISSYKDNPFLEPTVVERIERLKNISPAYWNVYGLGIRDDIQAGTIFLKEYYQEYEVLPKDVKSVIYTDPNLALKEAGDTTAITHLGFSPSTGNYYVIDALAQSFSDATALLDEVYRMRTGSTVGIGFDGNVTQESTWTNFVKNWAKIKGIPFPRIEYKRYKVDDLAKNAQLAWNEKKIFFPPGFKNSFSGKIYIQQVFSFRGKWAKQPDDAPDSLICAFEFIHERGVAKLFKPEPIQQPKIEFSQW